MVRLKDIADAVGVSLPVVSRVLNPKPDKNAVIADSTRKQVLEAAERLGYKRNRAAEFLAKGGRSATIGVFLPGVGNSLTAELMMGISEASNRHGFPVNFFFGFSDACYLDFMSHIISNANSGMITYPNPIGKALLKKEVDKYLATGGKVAFIAPYSFDFQYETAPIIGIDDMAGGALAAAHLMARGCRRLFSCCPGASMANGPRGRGFLAEVAARGQSAESLLPEEAEALIERFAPSTDGTPWGVFAHSDELALRLMRAAFRRNIRIGEDLLIIGYDDLYLTDKLPVSLTTIHQPFRELGNLVLDTMVKLLYDKGAVSQRLKPVLIKRESA